MENLWDVLPYLAPIILLQLALIVAALLDLRRRERTRGPKWAWVLAVLFIQLLGPICYFIFGRED